MCGTAEHDGCLPQPVRGRSAWTSFSARRSGAAVRGHHLAGSSNPSPARLRQYKAIIRSSYNKKKREDMEKDMYIYAYRHTCNMNLF